MSYYIDADKVKLDDLLIRIKETDLVPSRSLLLEGIEENFSKLKMNRIFTLADFRKSVKNSKNIVPLAEKTNINIEYLTLLRREVEGYFPKAFPLSDFVWLDKNEIAKLENKGYKNTALLYEALETSSKREEIFSSGVLDNDFVDEISSLVGLTRIQWVSPTAARMLFDSGYKDAKSVAEANAEELYRSLEKVNDANKYFKGNIGLRDVKRLIKAASYVL
ncbi:MAG: hypothetical protein APF77_13580 [Clostridia bacterium BRH_c25]|nr:MAG: hypothetical protein APF77_13580 [Clostridia bacterium BRH_c25]